MKLSFLRRKTFTVHDRPDIGRAAWRVVTRLRMPRIEIRSDAFPLREAQRSQVRLRHLHEVLERQTGGLIGILVLMVGLADMVRTNNRSLEHMGLLVAIAIGAGVGARLLGKAFTRLRVLLELFLLRRRVGKWSAQREAVGISAATPATDAGVQTRVADTRSPLSQDPAKDVLSGSCSCGTITFTLSTRPTLMGTCHCSHCRKSGASTVVAVRRNAFRLLSGSDAIVTRSAEPPHVQRRSFCSRCGTALGEITSDNESFAVAANCFDDELGISNGFHEFVSEKPGWYAICDGARQFPLQPPASS